MSYILEALRKADAERERGQVPGIHAQHLGFAAADNEAPGRSRLLLWMGIALGAALLTLAVIAWNGLMREPAAQALDRVAAAAPEQARVPAASAAPSAAGATTGAASPSPAAEPAVGNAAAAAAAASESPPALAARPREAPPATEAPKRALAETPPPPAAAPSPPRRALKKPRAAEGAAARADAAATHDAAKPQPEPAKAAPAKPVHTLAELPAEIRQQIPPLTIGGASYSSNPASRMLIVNGQVFHEHDRLTPDLQLQQIRLKSAVLEFKGWRYEIKY